MKIIVRRLISALGILAGLSSILIVLIAKSITNGIDVKSVNEAVSYVSMFGSSNIDVDIQGILILLNITKYSSFIVASGIISIMLFSYLWKGPKENSNNNL